MTGMYFEPAEARPLWLAALKLANAPGPAVAERFCDSDGEYQRKYDVYRLTAGDGRRYVIKRSSPQEIAVHERFLKNSGLPVPPYYGAAEAEGRLWMLTGYIEGPDLRYFTAETARACGESLSRIQNAWWGKKAGDGRFDRYWKRVGRRAGCLQGEPELRAAYQLFLARQREMPLTLSSGDFLPLNGVLSGGRVYVIDWGFGGMLPYALDIARLIAHGVEKPGPGTFPFRMEAGAREAFVEEMYARLRQKPDWERYLQDIRLAALNEYVEFIEDELNAPPADRDGLKNDFYYLRATAAAKEVLRHAK